jgi:hypothetical protein
MATEVDKWTALKGCTATPLDIIKQQLRKFGDPRFRFLSGIQDGLIETRVIDIYSDRVIVSDHWAEKGEAEFKGCEEESEFEWMRSLPRE